MNYGNIRKLAGLVTVKVQGAGNERFINALLKAEIPLWNMTKPESDVLLFHVLATDFERIQEIADEYSVSLEIADRTGFPVFVQKVKNYNGFLAGLLLGLAFLFLLANMIWHVEIEGASPELEYKLMKQLKDLGVYEGGYKFLVDNPQTLQKALTQMNEEITWIGVEIEGTAYFFQVVEKEQPEPEEHDAPRHLVAKKEAVIVDYFVEKGDPVVSINQFVKPGQILVTGLIGQEEAPEIVAARGKVWGKTWYKTEAQVKMKTKTKRLSGNKLEKRFLQFGKVRIPIAGFTSADYNNKEVMENIKPITLLQWELPVDLIEQTIYETKFEEQEFTEDEARRIALEVAQKDVLKGLESDARIVSQKILHEHIENDTLKISIIFDVVENIAVEQMIR